MNADQEVRQKNANALNQEQVRQRGIIERHEATIARLQNEIVLLRQEIAQVRMLTIQQIGRGATSAHS